MATVKWEFGTADSGLHFTIVYDTVAGTFTVASLEGKFDLNALWWNDGIDDGAGVALSKQDSSLNMKGSGEDWDGVAKLSNAGLGKEGEAKASFISEGETATFTLADLGITGAFDPASGGTLGVRATSVNGGDSIKLVDTTPEFEEPEEPDHFEDFKIEQGHDISHITLYWHDDDYLNDDSPNPNKGGPDGWFTVKINTGAGFDDDLDNSLDDILDALVLKGDITEAHKDSLVGVAIKGGQVEQWYDYNGSLTDNDPTPDPDLAPNPLVQNNAVDQEYAFDTLGIV
jgi:hypothetical protein